MAKDAQGHGSNAHQDAFYNSTMKFGKTTIRPNGIGDLNFVHNGEVKGRISRGRDGEHMLVHNHPSTLPITYHPSVQHAIHAAVLHTQGKAPRDIRSARTPQGAEAIYNVQMGHRNTALGNSKRNVAAARATGAPEGAGVSRRQQEGGKVMRKLSDVLAGGQGALRKLADTGSLIEKKKDAKGHGSNKKWEGSAVASHPGAAIFPHPNIEGAHIVMHPYAEHTPAFTVMPHGENTFRAASPNGDSVIHSSVEGAASGLLDTLKERKDFNDKKRAQKEHERKHGNESTGDISALHDHMHVHEVDGNWIKGSTKDGRHDVQLKVFSEGSPYGLNNGRVSKLNVREKGSYGVDAVNFDRGWDKKPDTEDHKQLVRGITNALKSKSVRKSDDGTPDELDTDPCEFVAPAKKEEQPNA